MQALRSFLTPAIERVLGIRVAKDLYRSITADARSAESTLSFIETLHRQMDLECDLSEDALAKIPRSGPLVVVANHPFGSIEATVLYRALSSVRPDVKFLANYLIGIVPESRPACIFVDPIGSKTSATRNLRPLREAHHWVRNGGALCIFPSGADTVVHCFGLDGLYTHSLLNFKNGLLSQMGPAIELGRALVQNEYQRSYTPLLLLAGNSNARRAERAVVGAPCAAAVIEGVVTIIFCAL